MSLGINCADPRGVRPLWLSLEAKLNNNIQIVLIFNLYAEYIMRNARLAEAQAGIKIAGEISITSDMQMISPLRQKVKRN